MVVVRSRAHTHTGVDLLQRQLAGNVTSSTAAVDAVSAALDTYTLYVHLYFANFIILDLNLEPLEVAEARTLRLIRLTEKLVLHFIVDKPDTVPRPTLSVV